VKALTLLPIYLVLPTKIAVFEATNNSLQQGIWVSDGTIHGNHVV